MWRKALALGLVLMAFGVVVGGLVEEPSFLVWKLTRSEAMGAAAMGAAAMGASGGIIAAAITKSSLTGLALLGATGAGIIVAVGIGL